MKYVALLRGINVGGKNRVAMADLVRAFEKAGARDVKTYIQSGNVVFDGAPEMARAAVAKLGVPVVVRTAKELRAIAAAPPPFPDEFLHVVFLADKPPRGKQLDPHRSPGDSFVVRGREIYLHLPAGAARSKLSNAWFDAQLGTVSTVRNWRTVLAIHALIG